jgi:hypothetical protein
MHSGKFRDQLMRIIGAQPQPRRKTEFMIYELLARRTSDDPELMVRDRDEQRSAMTWDAS